MVLDATFLVAYRVVDMEHLLSLVRQQRCPKNVYWNILLSKHFQLSGLEGYSEHNLRGLCTDLLNL